MPPRPHEHAPGCAHPDYWADLPLGALGVDGEGIPASVHYRPSENPLEMCATCSYFIGGRCEMFRSDVEADYVCDEWTTEPAVKNITAAAPSPTSAMIALRPLPEEAAAIADPDGEPASELHCTLVYLGEIEPHEVEVVENLLRPIAATHAPLSGTVSGYGQFGEGANVGVLLPDVPGLVELRVEVTEALVRAGIDYSRSHGFEAHITIDKAPEPDEMAEMMERAGAPLSFGELLLVRGGSDAAVLPFTGALPLTASSGPQGLVSAARGRRPPIRVSHLNETLLRAHKRVDELEPKLAAILEPILRHAGAEAAAKFSRHATNHLTAAAGPGWTPPAGDEIVDAQALVTALRTKTDPVRLALVRESMTPALSAAGLSWDVTNPLTAKVLAQSGSQIVGIADTTQLNVMRIVKQSYDHGLSIPDTATAIQGGMAEAAGTRATLIARTELAGAVNGGSLAAAKIVGEASGVEYYKQWMTAPGARYPRHEDYPDLDGQTVHQDDAFEVGDDELQFPGDPDGSPDEVCNCRCTMSYTDDPGDLTDGSSGGVDSGGGEEVDAEDAGDAEEGGEAAPAGRSVGTAGLGARGGDAGTAVEAAPLAKAAPLLEEAEPVSGAITDGPATEYLDKLQDPWGEKLSASAVEALNYWKTEKGYAAINSALRSAETELRGKTADAVRRLDRLIASAPPIEKGVETTVYRGVTDIRATLGGNVRKGAVITERGFTSVTTEEGVAMDYTQYERGSGLIKIQLPPGSKGAWLRSAGAERRRSEFYDTGENHEMLLPRDSDYVIVSVEPSPMGPVVTLRPVEKTAAVPAPAAKLTPDEEAVTHAAVFVPDPDPNFVESVRANYNRWIQGTPISDDAETYADKLDAKLNSVLSDADLRIRAPLNIASMILDDGRFKSQFETNRSQGLMSHAVRSEQEQAMFGYSRDLPPADRPIYGYLSVSETAPYTDMYGEVSFTLKAGVKERATFTATDSLGGGAVPSRVADPNYLSIPPYRAGSDPLGSMGDPARINFAGYWEHQVHGGLSVSDIDHVDIWGVNRRATDVVALEAKLRAMGIPVEIHQESAREAESMGRA